MKKNQTILKTIEPIKLILNQKRYIGAKKIEYVLIKSNYFQKENTHTKKEQYRCQLKNFRAKKEKFFEPKKK